MLLAQFSHNCGVCHEYLIFGSDAIIFYAAAPRVTVPVAIKPNLDPTIEKNIDAVWQATSKRHLMALQDIQHIISE